MHIDHFKEHFQTVTDQRQGAKITYCLFEVLFGSLCSVIAGAKGWFNIREYILGHHDRFKRNGLFLNDIPADDTIARIISTIEPEQFQECFINWMSSIHTLTEGQVIAIDGKTLRGSYNREDSASEPKPKRTDTLIKQNAIDKGLPIFDVLSKGRLVICGNRLNPTLKAVSYRSLGVLSVRCEVILKCLSFQAVRLHFPCVRTVLCGWVREQFTLGSGNHH